MAEMNIAGETFNVQIDGPDKAPVIMLSNSLGTTLHMWDRQISVLARYFKVVRYDSRGHGRSPVTGGAYSIAMLGRDALAIMDALSLDRVHWMGLSMGGMVGQWLLTHARERIGRAILANTAAQLGTPDMWNTRIRTVLSQGMGAIIPATIDRWFTLPFQAKAPGEIAKIVEMLGGTPAHGYAGCCGAIRDMDQRDSIRSISNPVLVIVGKHDPSATPEAGALIASSIRGARLVTLDAAHLSNIEAEAEFNKAIMGFMLDASLRFAPPAPAKKAPVKIAAKSTGAKSSARKAKTRKAAARKAPAPRKAAKPTAARKTVKASGARKVAKKPAKSAASKKTMGKATAKKKTAAKKAARGKR
jgi:3-oxoadipate enol-lactonase